MIRSLVLIAALAAGVFCAVSIERFADANDGQAPRPDQLWEVVAQCGSASR